MPARTATFLAAVTLLFGLLLLSIAVVQFVAARDLDRAGGAGDAAATTWPAILSTAGLVSTFTATAWLVRRWRAAMIVVTGLLFVAAAWTQGIFATEAQRREQAQLDQQWRQTTMQSAARDPRVLPGGRPASAPARGTLLRVGLYIAGAGLVAAGLGSHFALRRRSS